MHSFKQKKTWNLNILINDIVTDHIEILQARVKK